MTLFHRDSFAKHHKSIIPVASSRTIIDCRHIFMRQYQVFELSFLHDPLLDIFGACSRFCFHIILRRTLKPIPGRVFQAFGNVNQIRHRVVPEHERHAFIIPAVEVLRLRKVTIAAKANLFEPGFSQQNDTLVNINMRAFVARTIATAILYKKYLLRVRQRNDQWMPYKISRPTRPCN